MPDRWRAGLPARMALTLGCLLPYWRFLTFSALLVTDGVFVSDIFDAELPGRVMVANLIRSGRLPVWTKQLCSGYPLAGAPSDPIGLALFTLLPPVVALDLLIVLLLLVSAHGTYGLARRFGADRSGAVLAGLGFAGSGYIAAQLQHLAIMSTIMWFPVGLLLIDRAILSKRRGVPLALLGLLYANQVLAGFPQSAYICGLVYGVFAVFRALSTRETPGGLRAALAAVAGVAAALLLGAAAGAVVLLPLAELTRVSGYLASRDYRWATYTNFWPRNFFTFFIPYINGDASDLSYVGPTPFIESYGYVGLATVLLAIYGGIRERRRPLGAFFVLMTLAAFALVLGPRTPFYYAAYLTVPGLSQFRAPTRFMVVVELGLVLLAAIGLTRLRREQGWRWLGPAICVVTALDLFVHQPRQNAIVPAHDWLSTPRTAEIVRADSADPRTFTPHHRDIHRQAHVEARGWVNVEPYFRLRDLLEPNTGGGYWNVPSADCYAGLTPRWYVSVWSYHYFENSLISESAFADVEKRSLDMKPVFVNLLRAYGVTHVLSPYPGQDPGLTLLFRGPDVYLYRVEKTARVRFVSRARLLPSDALAAGRLIDRDFDPDREILLLDAPSLHPTVEEGGGGARDAAGGHAAIVREDVREIEVDATAPHDGFLLVADMYYPGWHAQVDGVEVPIYRANISVRGIALPKGRHRVRMTYQPIAFLRGLAITLLALGALLIWLAVAAYRAKHV